MVSPNEIVITPDRRQSRTEGNRTLHIQSTNVNQKPIQTKFSIAYCRLFVHQFKIENVVFNGVSYAFIDC